MPKRPLGKKPKSSLPPARKKPASVKRRSAKQRPRTTITLPSATSAVTIWLSGPAEPVLMPKERVEGTHEIRRRLEEVKSFAKLPWRNAPQIEKKRRLREFLTILMFEGRAGHIEISEAEELHLQSVGKKLETSPSQITPEEVETVSSLYKRLELFGARLPQISFARAR